MIDAIDSVVKWFANLAGGDVLALIMIFAAGSLVISAAKNAVKVFGAVVGGLAILYLIDPSLYGSLSGTLDSFFAGIKDASWGFLVS